MSDMDNEKLGASESILQLESCAENKQIALSLAKQARRSIEIVSRLLSPVIYNTPDFINAIRQFVTGNRGAMLRIIVFDPDTIVRNGHQLVNMAGDLSSFIEIRKASNEYKHYNQSLLIIDGTAYLHRLNEQRYEATANFNDRRLATYYLKEFNSMWETATQDPKLRRISL